MQLKIYCVNGKLPQFIVFDSLNCNRIWDLDPVYKLKKVIEYNSDDVEEVIKALEDSKIDLNKSDIAELPKNLFKDDYRYFLKTDDEIVRIALDDDFFRERTLLELYEMLEIV